jgi:hypothetical protein
MPKHAGVTHFFFVHVWILAVTRQGKDRKIKTIREDALTSENHLRKGNANVRSISLFLQSSSADPHCSEIAACWGGGSKPLCSSSFCLFQVSMNFLKSIAKVLAAIPRLIASAKRVNSSSSSAK